MDSEGAAPLRREDPAALDACLTQLSRTLDAQVNLARLYLNLHSAPSSYFKWEATEGAMERLTAAVQSFERDMHRASKFGLDGGGHWFSDISDQEKEVDSTALTCNPGPAWTPVILPEKRDLDDDVDGEATGSRPMLASIKEKRSSGMTRSSARPSNATVGTTMCTIKDLGNCESDDEEFSSSSPRKVDGGDREQEFTPRMTEKDKSESWWSHAFVDGAISPHWAGRLGWDLVVILFVLMDAIVLPFQIAYKNDQDPDSFDNVWLVLTTTVFAVDIVLNFNTAYEAGKSDDVPPGSLVTSRDKIAIHYLKGWFSIDVMSTIPWSLIAEVLTGGGQESSTSQVAKLTKVVKFVRFLRLMRMLRLAKLATIWERIEVHLGSLLVMQIAALVRVIMGIVAICHWNACIFWMVGLPKSIFTEILSEDVQAEYAAAPHWTTIQRRYGPEEDEVWRWLDKSRAEAYVFCFYWTLGVMRTMPAEVQPVNLPERIFVLVFMFFALSAFAITVAQITQAFFKFSERRRVFNEEFAAVRMHMRNIGATEALQQKVKAYLRHIFTRRKIQAKEKVLLDALPSPLKKRLHYQAKMVHLRKLDVTHSVPKQMLIRFSELAETCDFLPGDVLCRAGEPVQYAYVVVTGRLQELDEAVPLALEADCDGPSLPARKSWLQRNTALQVELVDQESLLSYDEVETSKKTVVVVESAEVLRIDRAKFQALLQTQHNGCPSCGLSCGDSEPTGICRRASTEAEREKNSQKHHGVQHAPATMAVSS